ncbi:MAG: type II secretion system secretin GspD [Proteobacteria bacterium]|nr:type II secretion system secretin GspD [Pseudomonadota bacterium]
MTRIKQNEKGTGSMENKGRVIMGTAMVFLLIFFMTGIVWSAPPAKDGNATPAAQPDKAEKNELVHLDFNDVDIRVFIKFISEITGQNFVIDRKVTGKISIISPGAVTINEAYRVFESVLEVHDFAAVKAGKMVKIVPAKDALQKNIVTRLKKEAGPADDRVVTQLIPLKYAEPNEIKRLFTPLISRNSSILSYDPTNMLIITDLASNIQRLMKILDTIDVTGIGQEITVIPLEFADSSKFTTLLNTVFKSQAGGKNKALKNIQFVADDRTNSVVVMASKGETENITSLVRMLDKEVPRGKEKIHVYYLENGSAEDLATVLQNLSKKPVGAEKGKKAPIQSENVQITADKSTNSLIIIAEKSDYVVLEDVIKQLDIPRTMVYIECLIMEVNVDKTFNLGMEWAVGNDTTIDGKAAGVGVGFDGGSGYSNTAGLSGMNPTAPGVSVLPTGFSLGVFAEALKIGDVSFPSLGAVIQAYKKDEDVEILSTPQILTTDNEEASISVGKKIPYLTKDVSGDTNYNNYEYKDVGISLKITPHINEDRKIRLKIAQETSRVLGDTQSLSPSTLKRTIDTTVIVADGSTVVLGGLIDESFTDSRYKVPCLGDIPIIKYLFSSIGKSQSKTNLYIFLTSHVVENSGEAKELYEKKYDEIKQLKEGHIKMYPGDKQKSGGLDKSLDIGPVVENLDVETSTEE